MSSKLRVESLRIPAARLGPDNPLPPLRPLERPTGEPCVHESVPEEARRYLGYGGDAGILPYGIQDDYDRNRTLRDLRVAVLENEILRATFYLDYGGRLYSLIHKPTDRELLCANPVFQPANLAVRNAWLSGGVEWNVSIPGHGPFTCSPLFAASTRTEAGDPVLRFYEYERIRGIPFQFDCCLPAKSPWLFVTVRIINPHDATTPMYWWSNIGVLEAEEVRVLAPADAAYHSDYANGMMRIGLPLHQGRDMSRPTMSPNSADVFFDIPEGRRAWVTALDGQGRGLIQTSTRRLRGRKLFVWGMNAGGRRWQEFLSDADHPYIEIQAGLAQTQGQCLPMPPNAVWTWIEAYGFMEADPEAVHGADWDAAHGDVEARLDDALPRGRLDEELRRAERDLDRPADELLRRGSGWGALERRRHERARTTWRLPPAFDFDDASLGDEQAPWLGLLETGEFPCRAFVQEPGAWMVDPAWREMLETAVATGRSDHWLAWLHLGVMRYDAGDGDGAREAWEKSLGHERSGWALRNLAVMARHEKDRQRAADLWLEASRLLPQLRPLAIECATALLEAERHEEIVRLYESRPPDVARDQRLRYLKACADYELGRLDAVETFRRREVKMPDIREGEVSLSDLWFAVQEKRLAAAENTPVDDEIRRRVREECPPPAHIDFRMSATEGS